MKKIAPAGTISWVFVVTALAGVPRPLEAQTPTADVGRGTSEASRGIRQIIDWGRRPVVVFDQNGVFLRQLDTGQLPPLPLIVDDADFNDTRTRIRIRIPLKSDGVETSVYLDTNTVVLSREPPPAKDPNIFGRSPVPAGNGPGRTYGKVAREQERKGSPTTANPAGMASQSTTPGASGRTVVPGSTSSQANSYNGTAGAR